LQNAAGIVRDVAADATLAFLRERRQARATKAMSTKKIPFTFNICTPST